MDANAPSADLDADRQYGSKRHASRVDLETFSDAMCGGAVNVADDLKACALVTFTRSGQTALFMTKYHPTVPVLGATTERPTLRRMCLFRGVEPLQLQPSSRSEDLVAQAEKVMVERGIGKPGDVVVYVGGTNLASEGNIDSVKVRRIGAKGLTRRF